MPSDVQHHERPRVLKRQFLVDKRFQFKYTFMVLVFSSLIFAVLGYQLYRLNMTNTEILRIQSLDLKEMIRGQDRQLVYILLGFFALQVGSLFVLGILITHRIAGPMHRVHAYLEELADTGELRPLRAVRSRDEFHEFFESLGAAIDKMRARSEGLKEKFAELSKNLEGARTDPSKIESCIKLCSEIQKI